LDISGYAYDYYGDFISGKIWLLFVIFLYLNCGNVCKDHMGGPGLAFCFMNNECDWMAIFICIFPPARNCFSCGRKHSRTSSQWMSQWMGQIGGMLGCSVTGGSVNVI